MRTSAQRAWVYSVGGDLEQVNRQRRHALRHAGEDQVEHLDRGVGFEQHTADLDALGVVFCDRSLQLAGPPLSPWPLDAVTLDPYERIFASRGGINT